MVGLAEAEVLEEHLVQLVIVVLARVHEHVVDRRTRLQRLERAREADDLRTRPDHRHDLQFLHFLHTSSRNVSGRCGSNTSFAHITVTMSVVPRFSMLCVYPGGMRTTSSFAPLTR